MEAGVLRLQNGISAVASRISLDVGAAAIVDGYMKRDWLPSCARTLERSCSLSKAKTKKQEEQDGQRSQTDMETGLGVVVEILPYHPGSVWNNLPHHVAGGHITRTLSDSWPLRTQATVVTILSKRQAH